MSADGSAEFAGRAIKAAMTGGMSGDVGADPKPGSLEYAQMVADRYGDMEDAAVEDGMDPAPTDEPCLCETDFTCLARQHVTANPPSGDVGAEVAAVLAAHRVNYHHRNVGPEPVTADNLRYTSCEGCDWLGGHHDEAGWEAHLADALAPLIAERVEAAKAEALREAADDLEAIRDEHEAEDKADGCESRFCGGWLLGQTHAAQRLTARAAALDPEATP